MEWVQIIKRKNFLVVFNFICVLIILFSFKLNAYSFSNEVELIVENDSSLSYEEQTARFPNAIKNLAEGIKSDNLGLRRSSLYFAGKYQISMLEEVIINQLLRENDPETKILIAIVLYKIGNEAGKRAIEKLAKYDENPRVRRMSFAILTEYQMTTGKERDKMLTEISFDKEK